MKLLSESLRNQATEFLRLNGILESAFLDLRQVQANHYLQDWLNQDNAGSMHWLHRTAAKRVDVRAAFPQYPCALICSLSYYDHETLQNSRMNRISSYAQGRDYHKVLGNILKHCLNQLKVSESDLEGRFYVDTGPISEKYLASHTSLGWIGKNTNLVHPRHGSFFFLGVLLINRYCDDFSPTPTHCGNCVRCLVACPTGALYEPFKIDSKLCLSYQTIESKEMIPEHLIPSESPWLYGCDDCQTVCPYNRFSKSTPIDEFKTRQDYNLDHFLNLDEEKFLVEFQGSPIRRIGFKKFFENLLLIIHRIGTQKQKKQALIICGADQRFQALRTLFE